jgi:hypothetical protein
MRSTRIVIETEQRGAVSKAAHTVFAHDEAAHLDAKMDNLMSFAVSDRYGKLRKQIGIAVASQSFD